MRDSPESLDKEVEPVPWMVLGWAEVEMDYSECLM